MEPSEMNHRFYVIQLINPPYEDIDQYLCVPKSWIREETQTGTVLVKYPIEDASETRLRVKDEDLFIEDWSVFEAHIKYYTNIYKDAMDQIKVLLKEFLSNEMNKSGISTNSATPISTSSSATPKRKLSSAKAKRISTKLTSDIPMPSTSQHSLDTHTPENSNTVNTTENSSNFDGYTGSETSKYQNNSEPEPSIKKTPKKAVRFSIDNPGPSTSRHSLGETCTRENSNKVNATENNLYSTADKRDKSSVNQISSELTNESLDPTLLRQIILDSNLPDLLQELFASVDETQKKLEYMKRDHEQHFAKLDKVVKLIECCKSNINSHHTVSDISNGTESAVVQDKENEIGEESGAEKQKGSEKQSFDEDDAHYVPTEKRVRRKPPIYDPFPSPLRYQKKAPGLVELMPKTGIYVGISGLNNCIRLAKEANDLALLLLPEIFTLKALRTKFYRELDKKATTVLLKYVEEYALKMNWSVDIVCIKANIRSKLRQYFNEYELSSRGGSPLIWDIELISIDSRL